MYMLIISLGYTCYVKSLINLTKFKKETDLFDWMNSFEFNKIINCLDAKCDIFRNIVKSPISIDVNNTTVHWNERYSFRMPHETNINESIITYKRRHERFLGYKKTKDNYLFFRLINCGRYEFDPESLETNYNEICFNRLMSFLPENSKIMLISDKKMTDANLKLISNKFIVVDDCMNPEHVYFGPYMHHKNLIIACYDKCFEYIDKNFNTLDSNKIHSFIKNEHLGIKS